MPQSSVSVDSWPLKQQQQQKTSTISHSSFAAAPSQAGPFPSSEDDAIGNNTTSSSFVTSRSQNAMSLKLGTTLKPGTVPYTKDSTLQPQQSFVELWGTDNGDVAYRAISRMIEQALAPIHSKLDLLEKRLAWIEKPKQEDH